MNTILDFKTLEEADLEDHPCSKNLQGKMTSFHGSLMEVINIASLEEDETGLDDLMQEQPTVWGAIVKASAIMFTLSIHKCGQSKYLYSRKF